ncbi:hypothetical protein DCC85_07295 [Paenibacillus sp. CAA11]|uniref:glycosyltransferase family 61 protein n=1 Tax=Paenibacillus sp. CAA11 TaxID=1532905 RepID=UPI000D388404|nr:glycosyltransferase family 61 protein [Paenibacillus sp. CAA11]AWB44038.1 hypothetical protein DCC85_07295 [Paenibacillus sp. CAA11]
MDPNANSHLERLPLRVIPTFKEWVSQTYKDPADAVKHYICFGREEPAVRSIPKGIGPNLAESFTSHLSHHKLAEQFVACIPDGRIIGAHGTVVTPDLNIIWELSPELDKQPTEHSLTKKSSFGRLRRTSETYAVLTSPYSGHYYHWLFEVLARIELIRRSGLSVDKYVINRNDAPGFQQETLSLLGIPMDQIVDCDQDTHVQAGCLIVPSFAAYTGIIPSWACQFIRSNLLKPSSDSKRPRAKRIYLSRADALYRRIANEVEVISFLKQYGFEPFTTTSLSALEQMQLFASAEAVLAPHGAGLTNLVYCSQPAKVIEIFSPAFIPTNFWSIFNNLGLEYYYYVAQSGKGLSYGWDGEDDIIVDLDQLSVILEMAGIEKVQEAEGSSSPNTQSRFTLEHIVKLSNCEMITELFRHYLNRDPIRSELEHYVQRLWAREPKEEILFDISNVSSYIE